MGASYAALGTGAVLIFMSTNRNKIGVRITAFSTYTAVKFVLAFSARRKSGKCGYYQQKDCNYPCFFHFYDHTFRFDIED